MSPLIIMLIGDEHFYPVFRDAVRWVAECRIVLDLGTSYRFRKEIEPFQSLFTGCYFAMGYRARANFGNRNVDVDGDIQKLPFASGAVDGILCVEVLEHVPEPQAAVDEIYRVLRSGGRMVLTTPFLQAYHGSLGQYGDFYRYTDEGLRWLLRGFAAVRIHPMGGFPYRMMHTVVPARLREMLLRNRLTMGMLNALDRRCPTPSPLRWLVWAEK